MINKNLIIVLALVAVLVLFVLNRQAVANSLDVRTGTPRKIRYENGELVFELPVLVRNTSQGSVRVSRVDFDVYVSGKYIGKAFYTTPVQIVAANTTEIPVEVHATALDLISAASGVVSSIKGGKVNLTIDGLVYTGALQIPVKQSFDFEVPSFLTKKA